MKTNDNPNEIEIKIPARQGWQCPRCGRGNSPDNAVCPCVSFPVITQPAPMPCYPTFPTYPTYPDIGWPGRPWWEPYTWC